MFEKIGLVFVLKRYLIDESKAVWWCKEAEFIKDMILWKKKMKSRAISGFINVWIDFYMPKISKIERLYTLIPFYWMWWSLSTYDVEKKRKKEKNIWSTFWLPGGSQFCTFLLQTNAKSSICHFRKSKKKEAIMPSLLRNASYQISLSWEKNR